MTLERLTFFAEQTESDGGVGTISTGQQQVYECFAEVDALKPSRNLTDNQVRLLQGYRAKIYVTKNYEPQPGHTVVFGDERLTIQGYQYTDQTKRHYWLTLMEQ